MTAKMDRFYDNIGKAQELVNATKLLDPDGNDVGRVIHRYTKHKGQLICHTSFQYYNVVEYLRRPKEEVGSQACRNEEAIFLKHQRDIEAITGLQYPESNNVNWYQYLRDAGYTVIHAL